LETASSKWIARVRHVKPPKRNTTRGELDEMTKPIRALLLHDTSYNRILTDGNVRERLAVENPSDWGIELVDYDYCKHELHDAEGVAHKHMSLLHGEIAGPVAFKRLFSGRDPEARFALLEALEFDVIAMAPGRRASAIVDERQLNQLEIAYKWLFAALAGLRRQFVLLTPLPLAPLQAPARQATRARELTDWTVAEAEKWENLRVLDCFDLLSSRSGSEANRLRKPYRTWMFPSRLNSHGADLAGLALVGALAAAAKRCPCPEPASRDVVAEVTAATAGLSRSA
jgi:hypothetical protein